MNPNCELCHGMGWYWAELTAYGKKGEFSRPCPECNPTVKAAWDEAGEKGRQAHEAFKLPPEAFPPKPPAYNPSTLEPYPQIELPERPAYFGIVYDGNKLEAHDVNIVHDLRLTPNERAYIDGALDMAIYNIMQLRRAENSKAKVGGVSEFLAMDTDRTETFIVIESIKREVNDE